MSLIIFLSLYPHHHILIIAILHLSRVLFLNQIWKVVTVILPNATHSKRNSYCWIFGNSEQVTTHSNNRKSILCENSKYFSDCPKLSDERHCPGTGWPQYIVSFNDSEFHDQWPQILNPAPLDTALNHTSLKQIWTRNLPHISDWWRWKRRRFKEEPP